MLDETSGANELLDLLSSIFYTMLAFSINLIFLREKGTVLCYGLCLLPLKTKRLISMISELSRLRGLSASLLTDDIELLHEEVRCSESASVSGESWSMVRVLRDKRLRLPLLLACSMQAGQQTSGINAVSRLSKITIKVPMPRVSVCTR